MSKKKIVISVLSVVLLVAMTVTALVSCSGDDPTKLLPDIDASDNADPAPNPDADEDQAGNETLRMPGNIELETIEQNEVVMLRYLGEATMTSTGSIIKHVEAIVHPDDAPNKAVDWSIEWAEGASRADEPIENYVKVYTNTPASTYATVECVQAFTGDEAIITVTTRKGGFKASISCTYVGYPDSFDFNRNGQGKVNNDSAWGKTIFEYDCGDTYNITFDLNNGVGVVGEQFNDWRIEFVHVYGAVNVLKTVKNASGVVTSTEVVKVDPSLMQEGRHWYVNFRDCGVLSRTFDAEIIDGQLQLTFEMSPTALYTYGAGPGGSGTQEFESFVDGKPIYYDIVIKEANSGLTKTINVRGITTTTGVSIKDTTAIVF